MDCEGIHSSQERSICHLYHQRVRHIETAISRMLFRNSDGGEPPNLENLEIFGKALARYINQDINRQYATQKKTMTS